MRNSAPAVSGLDVQHRAAGSRTAREWDRRRYVMACCEAGRARCGSMECVSASIPGHGLPIVIVR